MATDDDTEEITERKRLLARTDNDSLTQDQRDAATADLASSAVTAFAEAGPWHSPTTPIISAVATIVPDPQPNILMRIWRIVMLRSA
jgi:hypothetical protein